MTESLSKETSSTPSPSKSVFRHARRMFLALRVGCMLLLAAAAVQLVVWNRAYDPRFYRFLGTPPGRMLARVMQWPNLHAARVVDKPLSDYTDGERAWRDKLEARLLRSWPTHRLELTDGSGMYVRILGETGGTLRVQENLGGQGSVEKLVPRHRVERLEPYKEAMPAVTWRDVRFQMEYPDFHLTYFGHYTVLTDAPYFQVSASVEELERLRGQYLEELGSLVRFPKPEQGLQVLFFSREEDYRNHQDATAPELSSSAGFYSPLEDRMVVYNQMFSNRADAVREEVRAEVDGMLSRAGTALERRRILDLQSAVEKRMRGHARMETLATLRHEGAHHLSYTYGAHSRIHTENAWLVEGLAVYFESRETGATPLSHLSTLIALRRENRVPPLAELLAVRKPEDFEMDLPSLEAHEAYALSWSFFHYGMRPENRPALLEYLRALQEPADIERLMSTRRIDLIAAALGTTAEALELQWRHHLAKL